MVAIRGRTFKKPWRRSCLSSKLKSSSAPIGREDSWCFHAVGSSNAPLLGSTAAEGLPRIGRTSIATRWCSCGLPQSTSCSENFVIPPDVFGQTLSTGATAQDAHWEYKERGDYNYNDARNWYPQQVPTGTAEFPYNNFSIYLNISTTIGTWKFTEFSPSKQPLKFTNGENNQIGALTFTGQGIINDGDGANNTKAIIQNNSQATLNFTNGSVAGTRSCASYYGCTQINNSGY